jgi:RecB family exonuclease
MVEGQVVIPVRLSASSLQVAQLCLARWKAEYMDKTKSWSNSAADIGTFVHGALEYFVKAVYIDKSHDRSWELLNSYAQMSYMETFKSADMETHEFRDGIEMLRKWFPRNLFEHQLKIEGTELGGEFKIPYNNPDGTTGEIPFVYFIDRLDQLAATEWEVVDYKTIRMPLQPEDLEVKIQARAYALAVQIMHPECTRVKVTFDQLRHDPVGMSFTREDNITFWNYLCETVQRLINTPESDARPTLNPECGYCPVKYTCGLLQKNIAVGGYHSLSMDEKVILVRQLKEQVKAYKPIIEELEDSIYTFAATEDQLEWQSEQPNGQVMDVKVGSYRRRKFPAHEAAQIMGMDLFAQVGSLTIGKLDEIIKDQSLDADMRQRLADLIQWETTGLKLDIKPKKTI